MRCEIMRGHSSQVYDIKSLDESPYLLSCSADKTGKCGKQLVLLMGGKTEQVVIYQQPQSTFGPTIHSHGYMRVYIIYASNVMRSVHNGCILVRLWDTNEYRNKVIYRGHTETVWALATG